MDWNRNEPMGCQLFETPIFSKLKLFKPKLFKPKLFKPQTFGTNTFQTKNLLKTPPFFETNTVSVRVHPNTERDIEKISATLARDDTVH
jgi:hypothetical protein